MYIIQYIKDLFIHCTFSAIRLTPVKPVSWCKTANETLECTLKIYITYKIHLGVLDHHHYF